MARRLDGGDSEGVGTREGVKVGQGGKERLE